MPYVITEACKNTKDRSCVDVCPVDCIYEGPEMLYIHPDECIDCGACVPACPVAAIYDGPDSTPATQKDLIEANRIYRGGDAAAIGRAEALVAAHVAANASLMGVAPEDRAARHGK